MEPSLFPDDETLRVQAPHDFHVLDTPEEPGFDRPAQLAARVFSVPIALISRVASDRRVFKARVGVDVCETDRVVSLCAHVIASDNVMFVPEAPATRPYASLDASW